MQRDPILWTAEIRGGILKIKHLSDNWHTE